MGERDRSGLAQGSPGDGAGSSREGFDLPAGKGNRGESRRADSQPAKWSPSLPERESVERSRGAMSLALLGGYESDSLAAPTLPDSDSDADAEDAPPGTSAGGAAGTGGGGADPPGLAALVTPPGQLPPCSPLPSVQDIFAEVSRLRSGRPTGHRTQQLLANAMRFIFTLNDRVRGMSPHHGR